MEKQQGPMGVGGGGGGPGIKKRKTWLRTQQDVDLYYAQQCKHHFLFPLALFSFNNGF